VHRYTAVRPTLQAPSNSRRSPSSNTQGSTRNPARESLAARTQAAPAADPENNLPAGGRRKPRCSRRHSGPERPVQRTSAAPPGLARELTVSARELVPAPRKLRYPSFPVPLPKSRHLHRSPEPCWHSPGLPGLGRSGLVPCSGPASCCIPQRPKRELAQKPVVLRFGVSIS
jgi:hypothetical protein